MKKPICKIDGCDKPRSVKGFCFMHYSRFKRNGDPLKFRKTKIGCKVDGCYRKHRTLGFCAKHYSRYRIYGDPTFYVQKTMRGEPQKFIDRHVNYPDAIKCVEWPYMAVGGYGRIKVDGKGINAHRHMLMITQPLENYDGLYACHKPIICNNPMCINPHHLEWGTPKDNSFHRDLDGNTLKGHAIHSSKLTEQIVREIRKSKLKGKQAAEFYGVSVSTIYGVRQHRNWKHVKS